MLVEIKVLLGTGTQVAGLNRLMGTESFLPFVLICIDHVMLSFVYFVKIEFKILSRT
jgi:hypothetical protein